MVDDRLLPRARSSGEEAADFGESLVRTHTPRKQRRRVVDEYSAVWRVQHRRRRRLHEMRRTTAERRYAHVEQARQRSLSDVKRSSASPGHGIPSLAAHTLPDRERIPRPGPPAHTTPLLVRTGSRDRIRANHAVVTARSDDQQRCARPRFCFEAEAAVLASGERAIHLAQVRPCLLGLPPGTVDGGYRRDAARS